jgi:DNA-binding transcriptional LysR family regulator
MQHMTLAVREHIEAGRLVRVLAEWSRPFPGFHLYLPSRAQMPPKSRALRDFLIEKRAGFGEAASKARRR